MSLLVSIDVKIFLSEEIFRFRKSNLIWGSLVSKSWIGMLILCEIVRFCCSRSLESCCHQAGHTVATVSQLFLNIAKRIAI